MVVFICGSCNDSLKKSVVATHLARCKPASISCCDCSKEFSDESYAKHNQCISEDAKYGPESQRPLHSKEKGVKKQEDFTNAIRETLKERNISGRAELVLNKILEHANIPRIKNKFFNFLQNGSIKVSPEIIEEVWTICEAATKKMKENANQQTPNVKAKPVAQVTETPKDSKKKSKKLKQSEGEEVESGETTLLESSEGPDQGESVVEGGDQTNGCSVITKQSKKKKKRSKESESKDEGKGEEKENEKADEEMMESNGADASAETNEVDNDVKNDEENGEPKNYDLKKKPKKKKKRNHSETEGNQEKSSDPKEDELNEGTNGDECDPKKKKMADEKETTTTTSDTPVDQDADQLNGNSNEDEAESQPINWFKQLKRQIKDKETVELKDFKKMIKKLKKSHNLSEDVSQLTSKAQVKLMKRHNYCVADGQIKYTHLF